MKRILFAIIMTLGFLASAMPQSASALLDAQENMLLDLDKQIEDLQNSFMSISAKADILAKDNKDIQSKLTAANTTIIELQSNLKQYKEALFSNKDDTAYIITLFADAQAQLDEVNRRIVQLERTSEIMKRVICIGIPAGVAVGFASGVITYKLLK